MEGTPISRTEGAGNGIPRSTRAPPGPVEPCNKGRLRPARPPHRTRSPLPRGSGAQAGPRLPDRPHIPPGVMSRPPGPVSPGARDLSWPVPIRRRPDPNDLTPDRGDLLRGSHYHVPSLVHNGPDQHAGDLSQARSQPRLWRHGRSPRFCHAYPRFRKAFSEGWRVDDRGRCCLYEIVIPEISWNRARMSEYIRFRLIRRSITGVT
jgi:hypothetical protein